MQQTNAFVRMFTRMAALIVALWIALSVLLVTSDIHIGLDFQQLGAVGILLLLTGIPIGNRTRESLSILLLIGLIFLLNRHLYTSLSFWSAIVRGISTVAVIYWILYLAVGIIIGLVLRGRQALKEGYGMKCNLGSYHGGRGHLRLACISILCVSAVYLLALPVAYAFDPFEAYEPTGWIVLPAIANSIILALGAIGVMRHREYAWWMCEALLLINVIVLAFHHSPLGILYMVWLIAFSLFPPWRWPVEV